jgi:hypothetical protein
MRRIHTTIVAVGLLALAASPAFAQRQPGQFGNRPPPGVAQLLAMDKVQEELKLSDDEKTAITKITDKYKDDIASARQNMDRDKMADLRKKQNDEVVKAAPDILKADQLKRLNQLKVQAASIQAFTMDDVSSALKLTDDQKKTIKDSSDDLAKDVQDLFQNAQGDRTKMQEAMTKARTMRSDALDKIVNGLTDDQKKTWKDITGDKFEFPAPQRGNRGNRGNFTPGNRGNRGNRRNPNP